MKHMIIIALLLSASFVVAQEVGITREGGQVIAQFDEGGVQYLDTKITAPFKLIREDAEIIAIKDGEEHLIWPLPTPGPVEEEVQEPGLYDRCLEVVRQYPDRQKALDRIEQLLAEDGVTIVNSLTRPDSTTVYIVKKDGLNGIIEVPYELARPQPAEVSQRKLEQAQVMFEKYVQALEAGKVLVITTRMGGGVMPEDLQRVKEGEDGIIDKQSAEQVRR